VILDIENEPKGIIVAELLWPVVTDFLDNVPAPAQAIMLNRNNIEIGGGNKEDVLKKNWDELAKNNFADADFLVTHVPSSGYLVYKGNNWNLVLRTPVDEALAPLNRLFVLITLFLVGVVIVILIMGFAFGSRFVNPIKQLTKGAEAIKHGDLDQKIHVKSKDEIGFLALMFNDMAKSIKEKRAKLKVRVLKFKLFVRNLFLFAINN